MSWQERVLLGWIAPRGIVAAAVAAVFGPALAELGYGGAERLLPLVFTLILVTVLAHGLTIRWLARRLDLGAPTTSGVLIVGASPWTVALGEALKALKIPVMIVDNEWRRIRAARLAGLHVYYGDILSEASEQRLEFNDYGYLLAATANDAYNAHVCSHFAAEMGRNHVFQLPEAAVDEPDPRRLPRTRRGLIAVGELALYDELSARWHRGYSFQRTGLTDEYGYADLEKALPAGGLPVLLVRPDGTVQFQSPEQPFKPKAGDTVVWFGSKTGAPKTAMPQPAD